MTVSDPDIALHRMYRTSIPRSAAVRAFALLLCTAAILPASALLAQDQPLTFEQAVATALSNNERAVSARERSNAAQARVTKARAVFLPSLSVTGSYVRRPYEVTRTVGGETVTIQSLNALNATATATMTLIDVRQFPLYRQVLLDRDATRLDQRDNLRMLAFDAANAFLTALSTGQIVEAAQRRLDLARKNLDAARARFEAQLAGVNDVTRTELELATAERDLTSAQGTAETARLQLELMLNIGAHGTLIPPDNLLAEARTARPATDSLSAAAVDRRPDLAAMRTRAAAYSASSSEALLRILPAVALQAQYRATNEAGLSGKSTTWFAGANLSWNIFDGGAWYGDREERLALAAATTADADLLTRRVHVDVRTAASALDNAQAAFRQATVALDAARKNADENSALYMQGLTTALAVADANVGLFSAEVALANAQYSLALAYLDLRAATGLDPLGKDINE